MAQKMHCALQKTGTESGKKLIGSIKDSPSKTCQDPICKENLEVTEDSSPARKYSDSRCAFISFLTLESNGKWRIIAVPLHCCDHINVASGVTMDGLRLVLPPPIQAFKVDRHKDQHGCSPEKTFSVNAYRGRGVTGYVRRQPPYRSRLSTLKERSGKAPSQSLATCNNLSILKLDGINPSNRSDMFLDSSKTDKTAKKSSKRKTKKKSQQSKKFSSNAGSTEPETLSEGYRHSNSTSEACHNNDVDNQNGLVSCSTESGQLSQDGKLHKKECEGNDASEIVNIYENSIPGVDNSYDYTGVKHAIQSCSNSVKKGKQNKSVQKSSSVNKCEFSGNLHVRVGKENNHSVWQRVQRNDEDECCGEAKKASPTSSQTDASARMASLKRNCNLVEVDGKAEEKKQSKHKVGKKLNKRANAATKQEYSSYSRKGSHSNRVIVDEHGMVSKQQSAISYSSQENDQIRYSSFSRSHSHGNGQRDGRQTTRSESKNSESVQCQHICPNELSAIDENSVSIIENKRNVDVEEDLFRKSCNYISQSDMSEEQPMHLSYILADEPGELLKEVSVSDCNRLNNSSGSTMQKWIPIGLKDSGSSISMHSECAAEIPAKSSTSKNSVVGKHDNESAVSSFDIKATQIDQTARDFADLPRHECRQKPWNLDYSGLTIPQSSQASGSCLTFECKKRDGSEIDSSRITQAVSEACKMQLACDAIHTVSGGPIAEFERLLHGCSPVICQSPDLVKCVSCAYSNTLCRHEFPNLPLGCIWQWYEKHGSYGLEIRGQDYGNSNRLGADRFSFRAYFVPFLSAVQLFRCSNSQTVHGSANIPDSRDLGGSRVVGNSESSSNDGQNPIFSVLFPRPCSLDQSNSAHVDQLSCSEESPDSSKDSSSFRSSETTCSDEVELVFEYFESQPPQHRRPLYDKILELITGDGVSESHMYGDPTNLYSINMQDLHPKSWYAVAWYPIYRIPDSSFHTAFLTYHSFGHLVHRNSNMDFEDRDACVVSPVVGLQSYNAQGECWFQLRQSAPSETIRTSGLYPSEILRERLRTLEETASLMSRAVVNKGILTSTNKHHDYEFFLSRRR